MNVLETTASIRVGVDATSPNSPLVTYALRGLRRCWLRDQGRWSHIYHLDGRYPPNESLAPSDVFYTLNVLLGMSRLGNIPDDVNISDTLEQNLLLTSRLPVATYALGMALWATAKLEQRIPEEVSRRVRILLSKEQNWWAFRAQDLGMLLTGIVAQCQAGRNEWREFATPLFRFLSDRYHSQSGLFFDRPSGLRRRFASFASQTYLSIACYHFGEFSGNAAAIAMANACTRKLIALQGPRGEWPWFLDAIRGRVLDFYEVYSVHQYGMAPAFLECAERHDVYQARDALIRGFNWVLGENQLGRSMLIPELGLTIRSHVRNGELRSKAGRVLRAVRNVSTGRAASLIDSASVGLRLECRSYELGWILWSFGRRSDLPQITRNPAFAIA